MSSTGAGGSAQLPSARGFSNQRTLQVWVANTGLLGFGTGHVLAVHKVTNWVVLQRNELIWSWSGFTVKTTISADLSTKLGERALNG